MKQITQRSKCGGNLKEHSVLGMFFNDLHVSKQRRLKEKEVCV